MDNTWEVYTGTYYFFGLAFHLKVVEGTLLSAMVGVPEGYEIRLDPVGDHSFRMRGGPFNGAVVQFLFTEDGAVGIETGGMTFNRIDPDELEHLELVERLEAPPFELTPEKRAVFEALYRGQVEGGTGAEIEYDLAHPKSEFVRYLMSLDRYIFHGTGDPSIDRFEPVRTSVELYDQAGEGNLPAVYGTHDALWAMFFAVIDRQRLDGSIRNGVLYFDNEDGDQLPLYNFSVNQDQLADRPFRSGWLYMLPRDTFRRLKRYGDILSNEWASETAVRPAARLKIDPEDFPFLERIGGHDDGPLVRSQSLQRMLFEAARSVRKTGPESRVMQFDPDQEVGEIVEEFIALNKELMPGVVYAFDPGPPPALSIEQMPPAMIQVFDAGVERQEDLEFEN